MISVRTDREGGALLGGSCQKLRIGGCPRRVYSANPAFPATTQGVTRRIREAAGQAAGCCRSCLVSLYVQQVVERSSRLIIREYTQLHDSTMGDSAIHALAGAVGGCVSMVSEPRSEVLSVGTSLTSCRV